MRKLLLALVVAVMFVAGCGTTSFVPPQSAITPDGAIPQAPPVTRSLSPIHIDAAGTNLVAGFEGFSSCPYRDTVGTGHPETRGFGETEGITPRSPCISRSEGLTHLRFLIDSRYLWAVAALGVSLNQNQVNALGSFAYNLGAGIFTGTLRFDLQHRRFFAASQIMLQYDHANGVVLAGLASRRRAEVRLFLAPVVATAAQIRANRIARLRADYRLRQRIRVKLTVHRCRVVHGKHAFPGCPALALKGRLVNKDIRRLHALGV